MEAAYGGDSRNVIDDADLFLHPEPAADVTIINSGDENTAAADGDGDNSVEGS